VKRNLCHSCMEAKNDDLVCEFCGYNHNAPYLPSYLAPGVVLNERYLLGKLKSYNGESAIYIGFDTITETKILIKEYMPDTLCSREKGSGTINVNPNYVAQYKTFMSDFVELNKILSKMRTLNHINAAVDMFAENNTGYVVFPYIEGITLSEYIKNNAGELTLEEVKKLFPPLFTTLSLVHNAGIIHRGISPDVITVTEKNELKLQGSGFCISDARTANTELASELFSGYAAPEQYNSANWQGTWTDVYGISALLYRILTGITPDDAASRMSSDNLLEPALINRNVPPNISKALMNGMHMSGEMRVQTVTELVTQLFEQPEYNSMRLSSSSTQTITIPKQGSRGGYAHGGHSHHGHAARRTAQPARSSARISRKSIFFTAVAVTLLIGMFLFIILLIAMSDRKPSGVAGLTSSETSDDIFPIPEITTIMPMPPIETPQQQTAGNAQIYIMNDITGKFYEVIKSSPSYSTLTFHPEFEYTDTVPKGIIFYQSIENNEQYERGAEIAVKVSKGPKFVPIPEYIGVNRKDYFSLLDKAEIKYTEQEFETDSVREGDVVKLSKDIDELYDVEAAETLVVFIAKSPPQTTVAETTTKTTRRTSETVTEPPIQTDEPDIVITFFD